MTQEGVEKSVDTSRNYKMFVKSVSKLTFIYKEMTPVKKWQNIGLHVHVDHWHNVTIELCCLLCSRADVFVVALVTLPFF